MNILLLPSTNFVGNKVGKNNLWFKGWRAEEQSTVFPSSPSCYSPLPAYSVSLPLLVAQNVNKAHEQTTETTWKQIDLRMNGTNLILIESFGFITLLGWQGASGMGQMDGAPCVGRGQPSCQLPVASCRALRSPPALPMATAAAARAPNACSAPLLCCSAALLLCLVLRSLRLLHRSFLSIGPFYRVPKLCCS